MKLYYFLLTVAMLSNFLYSLILSDVGNNLNIEIVDLNGFINLLVNILSNYWTWVGILLFVFSSILWLISIRKVDLSIAISFASSIYIFTYLHSLFWLNTTFELTKTLSCLLLISGVILIANSNKIVKKIKF
jgi:hypothetical protein